MAYSIDYDTGIVTTEYSGQELAILAILRFADQNKGLKRLENSHGIEIEFMTVGPGIIPLFKKLCRDWNSYPVFCGGNRWAVCFGEYSKKLAEKYQTISITNRL